MGRYLFNSDRMLISRGQRVRGLIIISMKVIVLILYTCIDPVALFHLVWGSFVYMNYAIWSVRKSRLWEYDVPVCAFWFVLVHTAHMLLGDMVCLPWMSERSVWQELTYETGQLLLLRGFSILYPFICRAAYTSSSLTWSIFTQVCLSVCFSV